MLTVVAVVVGSILTPVTAPGPRSVVGAAPAATPGTTSGDVSDGVRHSVVRLYLAVFDRQPDADGLAFWTDLYVRGLGLWRMAHEFMTSEEWRSTYGDVDDDRHDRRRRDEHEHRPR